MSSIPACVQCGAQLRWFVEQKAWGCDRCQQLFPVASPPQQVPRPQVAKPAGQRSKWFLIVGALVMIAGGVTAGLVLTQDDDDSPGTTSTATGDAASPPADAHAASPDATTGSGSNRPPKPDAGVASVGSGSAGSGSAGSGSAGSGSGAGSGSAGGAGSGSAAPRSLTLPSACKEYRAALEKLVVCTKLTSKARELLKEELDKIAALANPTTPAERETMSTTCKQAIGSIRKSRAVCRPPPSNSF